MRRRTFLKAVVGVALGACAPIPKFVQQNSHIIGPSKTWQDFHLQVLNHKLQVEKFLINRSEFDDIVKTFKDSHIG